MAKNGLPNTKSFFAREDRTAWWIFLAGLVTACVSGGVVFVFSLSGETIDPVLGVGWATALVFMFWSLVLAWRSVRHGGNVRGGLWLSWLALTEIIVPGFVLYVLRLRGWQTLDEILILKPFMCWGGAIWFLLLWITVAAALPLSWKWLQRSEKRVHCSSGNMTPWSLRRRLRGLAWRVLLIGAPFYMAVFPIGLVICTGMGIIAPVPWLVRNSPAYAQHIGLRTCEWLCTSNNKHLPILDCLSDGVLLSEMEGEPWEDFVIEQMASHQSEELLAWIRGEMDSGNTGRRGAKTGLAAIADRYPADTVCEFLGRIRNDAGLRRNCVVDFVETLSNRSADVRLRVKPEIDALQGDPFLSADWVLAMRSDFATVEQRSALWEEELLSKDQQRLLAAAVALRRIEKPEGVHTSIAQLCQSPFPSVQYGIAESLFMRLIRRQDAFSRFWELEFLIPLAGSSNLAVRRKATSALCRMMLGELNPYDPDIIKSPGPAETPEELAERAAAIDAAKAYLAQPGESRVPVELGLEPIVGPGAQPAVPTCPVPRPKGPK